MTLPANDAFTLGLAHDETRRPHQSRSRSLPRSPSPKISFSPSKSTVTATPTSRVERGLARRANKQTSTNRQGAVGHGPHNPTPKPPLQEIEEKREDSPIPSPPTPIQKVDWEIPRKLLHSSIGVTLLLPLRDPVYAYALQDFSHCTCTIQVDPLDRSLSVSELHLSR